MLLLEHPGSGLWFYLGGAGVVVAKSRELILLGMVIAFLLSAPTMSDGYMPPPDPCEMVPMIYGPPAPPTCAGPPTIPPCAPCPPVKCYPRKLVGPPPPPVTICKCPPEPCPATYRVCPPPACPPPPCAAPQCGQSPLGFVR
jgi:hypothetical protein